MCPHECKCQKKIQSICSMMLNLGPVTVVYWYNCKVLRECLKLALYFSVEGGTKINVGMYMICKSNTRRRKEEYLWNW